MTCKHLHNSPDDLGWCCRSSVIIDYDGHPHDILMECEFGGDAQKCLDNLVRINNRNILWKDYATIRIRKTNPNALKFKQRLEEERMQEEIARAQKSGKSRKKKRRE